MHHLAKIMFGKFEQLPYRAECACGTAGDFSDHAEAQNYLAMHLTRLQGINSAEFVDLTLASLPIPRSGKVQSSETDERADAAEAAADAAEDEAKETAQEDAAEAKEARKKNRGRGA